MNHLRYTLSRSRAARRLWVFWCVWMLGLYLPLGVYSVWLRNLPPIRRPDYPALTDVKLTVMFVSAAVTLWYCVIADRVRRRRGSGDCFHCGYDLAGLPEIDLCPECGRPSQFHNSFPAADVGEPTTL